MEKAIRVGAIVVFVGFLSALIMYNMANSAPTDTAWNEAMTLGSADAANHYIMYTDITCPYCDKFSDAVAANEEEFESDYINGKDIYFEIRLTNINYYNHQSDESSTNSTISAEAAYCAANQNKFWEYYHGILNKLYEDYHSKGIAISATSEKMPKLEKEYFYSPAESIDGLNYDTFKSCLDNDESLETVTANTKKAQKVLTSGVPYFVFGSYKTSGFAGTFNADSDWEIAKTMLDAGL